MGSLVAELAEKLSSATNNFDIDEGTIYVNTSADTVGIGTTTPGSKLDVQGTMQVGVNDTGHDVKFFGATAGAYLEWDESADELELRGGAATPGKLLLSTAETTVVDGNKLGQIDFQAPLDSAGTDAILVGASIYAEADATFSSSVNATELVFATGASETAAEKMRITSDGKVGIGTTSVEANLHIHTETDDTDETGNIALTLGSTNSGKMRMYFGVNDAGNYTYIGSVESGTAYRYLTLQPNGGQVGIGTTAPSYPLDVSGTSINVASMMTTMQLQSTNAYNSNPRAGIIAKVKYNTGGDLTEVAGIDFGKENGTDGNYAGNMSFHTRANGSSIAQAMTITSAGKVGIGTTTPSFALEVSGSTDILQLIGTGTGGPQLRLTDTSDSADGDNFGYIDFSAKDSNNNQTIFNRISNVLVDDTDTTEDTRLTIATMKAGTLTSTLSVSAGNVGIGTTECSNDLQIQNDVSGIHNILRLQNVSTTADHGAKLLFTAGTSTDGAGIGSGGQALNSADLRFYAGGNTERMRIGADGLVLINHNFRQRKSGVSLSTANNFSVVQKWITTDGTGAADSGTYSYADTYSFGSSSGNLGGFRWYGTSGTGTGDAVRLEIAPGGAVSVAGAFSKGSGSFKIDHPLESKTDTHNLVHSFVEGPQADLIYRGKVTLVAGKATVNIDTVSNMTEGTFVALNTNTQCFTTNETGWDLVKGSVSGNILTITAKKNTSTDTISWLVVGERHDQHMIDTDWTDSNGKVIVEPEKVTLE